MIKKTGTILLFDTMYNLAAQSPLLGLFEYLAFRSFTTRFSSLQPCSLRSMAHLNTPSQRSIHGLIHHTSRLYQRQAPRGQKLYLSFAIVVLNALFFAHLLGLGKEVGPGSVWCNPALACSNSIQIRSLWLASTIQLCLSV